MSLDISIFNSNSIVKEIIELNQIKTLDLDATLANGILNVQFKLSNVFVTTGITGFMTISGKYLNGRIELLNTFNLANTDQFKIQGKFTQIIVNVTSLNGADMVVVSIDQCNNVI